MDKLVVPEGMLAPEPANTEPSLLTRITHIVQDIGRAGGIGSADCEQWADVLMDLLNPKEGYPKELEDLLWEDDEIYSGSTKNTHKLQIVEAYRRGKKSKEK
jgi:hypothetical protein